VEPYRCDPAVIDVHLTATTADYSSILKLTLRMRH